MMTQRPSLGKYGPLATVLLCALNGAITYWFSGQPLYGLLSFALLLGGVLAIQWFYRTGPDYSMTWRPGLLAWLVLTLWTFYWVSAGFWGNINLSGPTLFALLGFWNNHYYQRSTKTRQRKAQDLGI